MPYRLEEAKTGRAKCTATQRCNGSKIERGQLRMGVWVEAGQFASWKWRHWGCVTSKQLINMKTDLGSPDEIDGFEELSSTNKEMVDTIEYIDN